MVSILTDALVVVAATLVPLFIGLYIPITIDRDPHRRSKVLMAFSAGVMFWFFLDVMNDAVLLDVNQGFKGGLAQALLATSFAAGLLLPFGLERLSGATTHKRQRGDSEGSTSISFAVAVLVAMGIGFHALGEGIGIGSLIPSTLNMIDAIGGLSPAMSYVLHKILEGFVIGTFAAVSRLKSFHVLILGLVAGLPTIFGILIGISATLNSVFFFALGGAAALYAEYKLVPNFADRGNMLLYAVASLLGFYSMYLAGLLHS